MSVGLSREGLDRRGGRWGRGGGLPLEFGLEVGEFSEEALWENWEPEVQWRGGGWEGGDWNCPPKVREP